MLLPPCPKSPPGSEVTMFEPVVPVPKSRDSSGKSLCSVERMPPVGCWLVDLWGGVDPECWDSLKFRIFIGQRR